MAEQHDVTTGEIMEFLKDHMVTKEDFDTLKGEVGGMKAAMVTREDLTREISKQKLDILDGIDDKIANLKGDLVVLMRKEDRKVITLIGLLREKQVISEDEAKSLLGMEPFPQVLPT